MADGRGLSLTTGLMRSVLALLLASCWTLRVQAKPNLAPTDSSTLRVLVFGGNGLLGAPTVEALLKAGHNVTVVNRGNWYWDTASTIKPYVTHFRCDRMQKIEGCSELTQWVQEVGSIDVVIDFSAYHIFSLKEVLRLLEGRAGLYVFISTDSVYEVCEKDHEGFALEEDSLRPSSRDQRRLLEEKESYGHRKLECEEELHARRHLPYSIPYLILRLPDVIGPRDNTYRWWIYQLWMRLERYLDRRVAVPQDFAHRQLSLVYAPDVARLILAQLHPSPAVLNRAFNLAFNETPTLVQMLNDMKGIMLDPVQTYPCDRCGRTCLSRIGLYGHQRTCSDVTVYLSKVAVYHRHVQNACRVHAYRLAGDEASALNLSNLALKTETGHDVIRLFPSVSLGPVNTSRALHELAWQPSPWKQAVQELVAFYEDATRNPDFEVPRRDIIRTMQMHFTSRPFKILGGLKHEYDVHYPEAKDEL